MCRVIEQFWGLVLAASICSLLAACGGGSDNSGPSQPPAGQGIPQATSVPLTTGVVGVKLKPPILSFTDTGLNVADAVTQNGLWAVTSEGFGWEYSLDMGSNWIRGVGDWFEVTGDGPKMIWVRSTDDSGNTSEIVIVSCVLDTAPPQAVSVSPQIVGITRTLQIAGLETGARWEYSFDEQRTWLTGAGSSLAVLGNELKKIWLRQVDIAGNLSVAQSTELEQPGNLTWHEASGIALQPSILSATGIRTMLIHGAVVRNDADYIRWDIPEGHRLLSVRLVHYVSDDNVAFYAIQRSPVFDAGFDVNRMLVFGHMGPQDLTRNVVSALSNDLLGAGPMTLWFQQTGLSVTRYAIEVIFQPL